MPYPLFPLLSVAGLLIGLSMANSEAVKAGLSTFKQWCLHDDLCDVIAVLIVIGVAMSFLLSWGWY